MMVWGCGGWNGVGIHAEVEKRMDAKQYMAILEYNMSASLTKLELDQETFIFQQDNDPKHTSGLAYEWFYNHGIQFLDWPTQFPDPNPIEIQV